MLDSVLPCYRCPPTGSSESAVAVLSASQKACRGRQLEPNSYSGVRKHEGEVTKNACAWGTGPHLTGTANAAGKDVRVIFDGHSSTTTTRRRRAHLCAAQHGPQRHSGARAARQCAGPV